MRLWERVSTEQALLDEWLQKSDGQLALSDQKKAHFRKMEKWNSVFAASRATRKKRSLLQMMKNKKKWALAIYKLLHYPVIEPNNNYGRKDCKIGGSDYNDIDPTNMNGYFLNFDYFYFDLFSF